MSMKTILVPTENDDSMRSALETALLLARRCDSYIEGFALRQQIIEFVEADLMHNLPVATYRQDIAIVAKKARQRFDPSCRITVYHARMGRRSCLHSVGWMRRQKAKASLAATDAFSM